jgi:hypothetical protein
LAAEVVAVLMSVVVVVEAVYLKVRTHQLDGKFLSGLALVDLVAA